VTSLAIMGLLPPPLQVLGGTIRLRGRDLATMSEEERRALRGSQLGMIFQDPMTALNPVRRVGHQIARALAVHRPDSSRRERRRRVIELLSSVGVPQPAERATGYPHEWSGGMRQRAVIAMAMANSPDLLIADEPTTALDTTVQAQVMETLSTVRGEAGASMLLITHDLGLVAQVADRVAIMYAGRLVEQASVTELYADPQHPYTRGLLASILTASGVGERATAIPGTPPQPTDRPPGCAFAARCGNTARDQLCEEVAPVLITLGEGRTAACHHLDHAQTVAVGAR
jgi:peptide/nickel transport system ATP-binding protein